MEVITGVLQKKPKAANEELLVALNHYLQTYSYTNTDTEEDARLWK